MNRKRSIIGVSVLVLLAIGVAGGMYFQPHRNVEKATADYEIQAQELVAEFLEDAVKANAKYLAEDGDSKILVVEGVIKSSTNNLNDQVVVLLQNDQMPAGVTVTFQEEILTFVEGETIKVKGVIKSGAAYDSDMELYTPVVLDNAYVL